MAHYLRPMLVFAATAGIASMLAGAAPALAADVSMTGGQPAVKVLPSTEPHHALRPSRTTVSRYDRQIRLSNGNPKLRRRSVRAAIRADGRHRLLIPSSRVRAFSSEVDTPGARKENPSKQKARASVPIESERRL